MNPGSIFDELANRVSQRPELVDDVGAIYQFDVGGEAGGSWVVDLKNSPGSVRARRPPGPRHIFRSDYDGRRSCGACSRKHLHAGR